jgi:hypothetical protein
MTPEQFTLSYNQLIAMEAATQKRFLLDEKYLAPMLSEDTTSTGFDRHYLYHGAWALRALKRIQPSLHYDFSSSLFFAAAASAWFPVHFCDLRPADIHLDGLSTAKEDLLRLSLADNSVDSASCMHVVEHVGLGRYGDEINYDGDLKAVAELKRITRPGGNILFVVPVGKTATILFNAHRIYTWKSVLEMFGEDFDLVEGALIPEQNSLGLVYYPDESLLEMQGFACGCFWFCKKQSAK